MLLKFFSAKHILAVILFVQTLDRSIKSLHTKDYLWEKTGLAVANRPGQRAFGCYGHPA